MYETTIGVDGMMCDMCEIHIQDKIRKDFDVKKVKASKNKKQAVVISESPLDEQAVKASIEETGYEFTGFSSKPYKKKGLFH